MIQPILQTPHLVAGQDQELVIALANKGPRVCRGVVFRVRLPVEIISLHGAERVDIVELLPGAAAALRLMVRPVQIGSFLLASSNFHYRDSRDQVITPPQWRQDVVVAMAQLTPEQQAAHEAGRHARAQRWDAAWPLFLQARDNRQALGCFQHAVRRLHSDPAGVAAQYLAYAQTVRQIGQPDLGQDPEIVQGLDQALTWYAQAGQSSEVHQCRELLSYLTRSPLMDVRLVIRADAVFTIGAASLVAVQVTNRGYGPAREVRLALSGMLERPVEHTINDLAVGKTETWSASVVPTHAGPCAIKLDAAAHPYGGGAAVHASCDGVVTAQPADFLGQISRAQVANVRVTIGNYAASGGANIVNQDGVVITRGPLTGGAFQRPVNPNSWSCPVCRERTDPDQKFCSRCGASLAA